MEREIEKKYVGECISLKHRMLISTSLESTLYISEIQSDKLVIVKKIVNGGHRVSSEYKYNIRTDLIIKLPDFIIGDETVTGPKLKIIEISPFDNCISYIWQ